MPLPEKLEKCYDSAFSALNSLKEELEEGGALDKAEFKAEAVIIGSISSAIKEVDESYKMADTLLDPPAPAKIQPRPGRAHSEVHSFIFPKQEWTPVTARAWLRDHKKSFGKMDVVGSSFHFKQTDTAEPEILGTIVIQQSPRIMATLEPRKP